MSRSWEPVISARVFGHPRPQPRPRAFAVRVCPTGHRLHRTSRVCPKCGRPGQFRARVNDPSTAEGWKSEIAAALTPHLPADPLEGPVRVDLDFLLPRPQRLMRKKDPADELPCTAKPDRDNLEKAVLDAMTTLGVFRDDSQVVAGEVRKMYHAKGDRPGARISISIPTGEPSWSLE